MTEIDEPDEPQISADGGIQIEGAALGAAEIAERLEDE
jgi:hypothetical protein